MDLLSQKPENKVKAILIEKLIKLKNLRKRRREYFIK